METIKETGLAMAKIIEEHDGLRLLERSPAAFYGILTDLVTNPKYEVAKKLIKKGLESGVYTKIAASSDAERSLAIIDGISVLTTRELLSEEYAKKSIAALLIALDTSEKNIRYVCDSFVGIAPQPTAAPRTTTTEAPAPAPQGGGRFGGLRPGSTGSTTSSGGGTVSSTSGVRLGGRFGGLRPGAVTDSSTQDSGITPFSGGVHNASTPLSDFEIDGDTLVRYLGRGGDVHIPLSIKNIGKFAFQDCTALTSVSFPAGLKTIGASAFRGCTGLTVVSIPNSVEELGTYAFFGCTNITNMKIPDKAIVRNNALKGVNGVKYY